MNDSNERIDITVSAPSDRVVWALYRVSDEIPVLVELYRYESAARHVLAVLEADPSAESYNVEPVEVSEL